ncbi:MAG: menaquinone biosynthesis decarboxylase [Mariniphaga sp.]
MAFQSLRDFVELLDKKGELIRVSGPVNPELEITEIVDRMSKTEGGGKALLFENNGTQFPVLINAYGSENRMALALSCENLDHIGAEIEKLFKDLSRPRNGFFDKIKVLPFLSTIASWMPKKVSGRGKCQEVVMNEPDLSIIPILKCWPADGGRFITLPCVVTRDPETGIRNVGMYRMQVMGKDVTGMHWHKHKTGARHYAGYKAKGKRMPISVVIGGDPAYTYAATAPLPDPIDEYLLAGFLRKKKVQLVKCLTNDLEVPADADFILEGYVDPQEDFVWEGPFGDHTGFYSLADWYPKFHITCITHRKDAIYQATIVGIPPQEDAWIGRATERIFLAPMKLTMIPELLDMELPPAGVAHNLTIAKITKSYAGQGSKVMNAMWGAGQMMFNKILIIADQESDIKDYWAFAKIASRLFNPLKDIHFSQGPMDVLDHSSSQFAYGSKIGIDATIKYKEEKDGIMQYDQQLIDIDHISKKLCGINGVVSCNLTLLAKGISAIILGITKETPESLTYIINDILSIEELWGVKLIAYVDPGLDIFDISAVVWYVSGNIDPRRDCKFVHPRRKGEVPHLVMDGTRKTLETDGFQRLWPNPVASSSETIAHIDKIWSSAGLGKLVPSPSLKVTLLKRGDGAVSI